MALGFESVWKMKKHISSWYRYEPDAGRSRTFQIDYHRTVHAATYNMSVLEGPNSGWLHLISILNRLVIAAGGDAFVIVVPWWSNRSTTREAIRQNLPSLQACANESILVATGLLPDDIAERALTLRERVGGAGSGLWAFGTADPEPRFESELLEAVAATNSTIFGIAGCMSMVRLALCLDDGVDMAFCRSSPLVEASWKELSERLRAVSPE